MENSLLGYLSIVASVVSVLIGIFAIWLSVTFYKMSNKSAEDIKQSSNTIDKTVNRLEAIFEKLYSDTFTMVKDTVTDMRQHIWSVPLKEGDNKSKVEEVIQEKTSRLLGDFSEKISDLLSKQVGTELRIEELHGKVSEILDNFITESRKVEKEVKQKITSESILAAIKDLSRKGITPTLVSIAKELNEEMKEVVHYLFRLSNQGKITWKSLDEGTLGLEEKIEWINEKNQN